MSDLLDDVLSGKKYQKAPEQGTSLLDSVLSGDKYKTESNGANGPFKDMEALAKGQGFTVTSGYTQTGHNVNSPHYDGRAIDVRTRDKTPEQIDALIAQMKQAGYEAVDERTTPAGPVWTGPHIHFQAPRGGAKSQPASSGSLLDSVLSGEKYKQAPQAQPKPQVQPVQQASPKTALDVLGSPNMILAQAQLNEKTKSDPLSVLPPDVKAKAMKLAGNDPIIAAQIAQDMGYEVEGTKKKSRNPELDKTTAQRVLEPVQAAAKYVGQHTPVGEFVARQRAGNKGIKKGGAIDTTLSAIEGANDMVAQYLPYAIPGVGAALGIAQGADMADQLAKDPSGTIKALKSSFNPLESGITPAERAGRTVNLVATALGAVHGAGWVKGKLAEFKGAPEHLKANLVEELKASPKAQNALMKEGIDLTQVDTLIGPRELQGPPNQAHPVEHIVPKEESIAQPEPVKSMVEAGVKEPIVAFHGTPNKKLSVPDPSKGVEVRGATFFTSDEATASQYTSTREYGEIIDGNGGKVIQAKLHLRNPMEVDFKGAVGDATRISKLVEEAKANGHDGLILKNVVDTVDSSGPPTKYYAVFDKGQVEVSGKHPSVKAADGTVLQRGQVVSVMAANGPVDARIVDIYKGGHNGGGNTVIDIVSTKTGKTIKGLTPDYLVEQINKAKPVKTPNPVVEPTLPKPEPKPVVGEFSGQTQKTTGLSNAHNTAEGLQGEKKIVNPKGEDMATGKALVDSGKIDPIALSKEIAKGDRTFTTVEHGAILEGKRRLMNEVNAAKNALDDAIGTPNHAEALKTYEAAVTKRDEFINDTQKGKSEWANIGRAMAQEVALDTGNFAEVTAEAQRLRGNKLPPKVESQFKDLTDKLTATREQLDNATKKLAERDAQEVIKRTPRNRKSTEQLDVERDAALAELKKAFSVSGKAYAVPVEPFIEAGGALRKLAMNYAERGIYKLEDVVLEIQKHFPNVTREQVIQALTAKGESRPVSELAKQRAELMKEARRTEPAKRAALVSKIKDLEEQIKTQTFKPRDTAIKHPELKPLQDRKNMLDRQIKAMIDGQKPKTFGQKASELARTSVLSGLGTFNNLATAVAGHVVISPWEELAGPIVKHTVGRIGGLAEKAGSELAFSPKAEFAAATEFVNPQSYKDVWSKLKTGEGSLKDQAIAFGLDSHYPSSVNKILKFEQNTHGAIKTFTERNAFAREWAKSMTEFSKKGLDVNNPDVRMDAFARAYGASKRALLQNDSVATKALSHILNTPQAKGFLRVLVPVSKIPVNMAGRAGEFSFGLPYAASRHIMETLRGDMTEESAKAIARAYKRGGVGAALFVIGATSQSIKADGRGELKIGNKELPHSLGHVPWLEPLKMGAMYRDAKGGLAGVKTSSIRGAQQIAGNTPFVDLPQTIVGAAGTYFDSTESATKKAEKATGQIIKSLIVPQLFQQSARMMDKPGHKIKPKGIVEEIQSGIPYARQKL